MRDAARAAEMSDPDQNRWFRRKWVEDGVRRPASAAEQALPDASLPVLGLTPAAEAADLELLGRDLLAAWRRERARAGGQRDV